MKRRNATRNALLTSILSLLLCVSMLVGTTFAWFTDSVESGINQIAAGNLDVELYHGKIAEPTEKVDSSDKLFTDFNSNLIEWWEPGVVAYTNLKVANVGTLALKYQMALNFSNATAVEHEGKTYTLADVLKVAVVEGGFTGDRAAAHALEYNYTLSSFELKGELKGDETTDTYGIVVYWEPGNDDYDNIFNLNNGKTNTAGGKTLSIDLGVNLFASQLEYEEDSFNINYDKNAAIFVSTTAELQAAINNVQNNGTICLNDGTYDINSQLTVPGKSVNFVGVGENVVINMTDKRTNYNKFFYIYGSATEGEDVTVNISNITLTAAVPCKSDIWIRTDTSSGAKVSGDVTVNLYDVTCTSVICDNNYVDGDAVNLNVYDSTIERVTLDASPFNGNGLNTKTNLTYENSRLDHINIQNGAAAALGNITINGVNPAATGEQQAYTYASSAAELQEVLNAAGAGDHYIVLFADIEGDVIATQKEGVNITIDGADHEYKGSIEIYGSARSTGAETLTIKNVNFVADKGMDFIHCNSTESAKRYAHNVTVEDCTFTGVEGADVVATRFRQCYNIEVKDCTGTKLHSVMWATGGSNITVDGVTATCASGGVSFGTSTPAVAKNCNFTVTGDYGYGVRFDASGTVSLTVESSTISADAPVLVRKATGTATVTLSGNTLTSAKNNTVVVTAADYEEGKEMTAPTGKIDLTIDGQHYVSSAAELAAAVAAGQTDIYLLDGEYNVYSCGSKTLTLTGLSKNVVLKVMNEGEYGMDYGFDSATVTFNGITIDTTSNGGTYPGYARLTATFNNCDVNGTFNLAGGNKKFTDCKLDVTGDAYNIWTWGAPVVTFDNCEFTCDGKSILVYNQSCDLYLIDCTFTDRTNGTGFTKSAVETGVDSVGPVYNIYITNTTVNGFAENDKCVGYQNVVGNKNSMGTDKLNIVVDDVDVF